MEEEEEEVEEEVEDTEIENETPGNDENKQENNITQVTVEKNVNSEKVVVKKQPSSAKVLRSSKSGKKRRFYNDIYNSGLTSRSAPAAATVFLRKQKKEPELAQKDNNIRNQDSKSTNSRYPNMFSTGDSFDNYGRYVSSELRSLKSRYAQEFTKLKIQQALFEAHFLADGQQQQDHNNVQFSMTSSNTQPQVVILPTSLQNAASDRVSSTE